MKYSVGGVHARRMDFCRYLATRQLSVDVWDGDSLLQVGTASVDLRPLLRQVWPFARPSHTRLVGRTARPWLRSSRFVLRLSLSADTTHDVPWQGRDFSEVLLEIPVHDHQEAVRPARHHPCLPSCCTPDRLLATLRRMGWRALGLVVPRAAWHVQSHLAASARASRAHPS